MTKRIILSVMIALAGLAATAQDFNKAKLDSVFTALETNEKFMGSTAVMRDGKLLYTRAIGLSDREMQKHPDENTRYRIGSITKTFTSVLVLKAKEEGKLNLDDTIDKYFPEVPNAKKITIRHLLSHRSGIHNFTSDPAYETWNTTPKTRAELVKIIGAAGSDFEPGTKAAYSNSGFVLLSFVLEDVYKTPYAKLIREKITTPIGLRNTYVGGKIKPEAGEAKSYKYDGTWKLEKETDMSIPMSAGAIVSTPTDLVHFAEALFSGKLISAASLQEMKTLNEGYGLGLFTFPFYDKTTYGHTGGIDGFTSFLSYDPDNKIAYALISNGSNYNNNNLSIAVLSAAYNKPFEVPRFSAYKVTSEELDQYLGDYASKDIPLKITIAREGSKLIAKVAGQGNKPLDALEKDKFGDELAGVILVFNPKEKSFVMSQGGRSFLFVRG
ncbi:serine hydrolase domain-containing protein [Sediminibacterium ginsengisoli]|uniref:CubicO group peptidase, beta-lactamase class C family n=1 Tax=Sediminibacterium ginsengisoli TaxID=413434 RepID=A0A1T4RS24_9BACT|nr:serine hydrolase domain-containing protein [Sediminibacterium ginsengisoli]SKA18774.1 CubicO group peptidase, beta-lactamase class C family [Sediminibacterium ginsengisoli]